MVTTKRRPVLAVVLLALAACGGGGNSKSTTQTGPSATVTVSLDGLMTQGTSLVLPTYVSHLIGTALPLASVTVKNTGPASAAFTATIDVASYQSAQGTNTVTLAPGASQTFDLSPTLNYASLFGLTTALPSSVHVKVVTGTTTVYDQTTNVTVSSRNAVFWSEGGQSQVPLVAAMVTPTDKDMQITNLAHDAGLLFVGGTALVGYQPQNFPSQSTAAISPNSYFDEPVYVTTGEGLTVGLSSVLNGLGTEDTGVVYIMDDANFTLWSGGNAASVCGQSAAAAAGTTVSCSSLTKGTWHIVYFNPNSNVTSRTFTRARTMSHREITYEQGRAIFTALRNKGLIYANLPGTGYFDGSQNVMYPSESLATLNANCIEGSLVFASIFERLGMEPIVTVSFQHGHAIMGVRCWTGTNDCIVPIETTAVGGATTFDAAVTSAIGTWNTWVGDGTAQLVDVKAQRAQGITPAPM